MTFLLWHIVVREDARRLDDWVEHLLGTLPQQQGTYRRWTFLYARIYGMNSEELLNYAWQWFFRFVQTNKNCLDNETLCCYCYHRRRRRPRTAAVCATVCATATENYRYWYAA